MIGNQLSEEQLINFRKIQDLETSLKISEAQNNMLQIEKEELVSLNALSTSSIEFKNLEIELGNSSNVETKNKSSISSDCFTLSEVDSVLSSIKKGLKDVKFTISQGYVKIESYYDRSMEWGVNDWNLEQASFVAEMSIMRAQLENSNVSFALLNAYFSQSDNRFSSAYEVQYNQFEEFQHSILLLRSEIITMIHSVAPEFTVLFPSEEINQEASQISNEFSNTVDLTNEISLEVALDEIPVDSRHQSISPELIDTAQNFVNPSKEAQQETYDTISTDEVYNIPLSAEENINIDIPMLHIPTEEEVQPERENEETVAIVHPRRVSIYLCILFQVELLCWINSSYPLSVNGCSICVCDFFSIDMPI